MVIWNSDSECGNMGTLLYSMIINRATIVFITSKSSSAQVLPVEAAKICFSYLCHILLYHPRSFQMMKCV